MRTQFTGVEQGSTIRDEINSDVSAGSAVPEVQTNNTKFTDTAEAAVSLSSVVRAFNYGEMAVALYASEAATGLLVQALSANEIETLACQGLTAWGSKAIRHRAYHLFEGDERKAMRWFSEEDRIVVCGDRAWTWTQTDRARSVIEEACA